MFPNWLYKKQVTVTGQSGAGTDYQVLLKIGASVSATGDDFHLEGNSLDFPAAKNDGGDLRFANSAEDTELSFWVEKVEGTGASAVAHVWVKVGENLDTNKNIFVYYGNNATSSASSGSDTFVLFDEMTSYTTNWTATATGSSPNHAYTQNTDDVTVSGTISGATHSNGNYLKNGINLGTLSSYGGLAVRVGGKRSGSNTGSGAPTCDLRIGFVDNTNATWGNYGNPTVDAAYVALLHRWYDATPGEWTLWGYDASTSSGTTSGSPDNADSGWDVDTVFEFQAIYDSLKFKFTDGYHSMVKTSVAAGVFTGMTATRLFLATGNYSYNHGTTTTTNKYEYVAVRKVQDTEPVFSLAGSEQSNLLGSCSYLIKQGGGYLLKTDGGKLIIYDSCISDISVSTSDTVTITESVTASLADISLSTSDSITITEEITVGSVDFTIDVSTSDTVTITESVTAVRGDISVSTSDTVTITESVTASLADISVSTSDTVTITESVTASLADISVSTSDTVTITESVTAVRGDISVSTSDTVTITESVTASLADISLSTSDSITITEEITVGGVDFTIDVFDSILIQDAFEEYAREIVSCDVGSRTGEMYVKLPFLSTSEDTKFQLFFGNAAASDYAVTDTYGSQAVWAGFDGVYHLKPKTTGANLFANSGFEVDLSGITAYVNGGDSITPTITRDTVEFYTGVASLKHVGSGTSSHSGIRINPTVVSGKSYVLRAKVKGDVGNNLNLYVGVTDNPSRDFTQTGDWIEVSMDFRASTTSPSLYIRTGNDNATFYVDEVEVYERALLDSSSANNTLLTNDAKETIDRFGNARGAFSLDTTDIEYKIEVNNTPDLGEVGDHTFSLWVNPPARTGDNYLLCHYNWRLTYPSTGNARFTVGRMTDAVGPAYSVTQSDNLFTANDWHRVKGVYHPDPIGGNGYIKIYVDGLLKGTFNIGALEIWAGYGNRDLQWGNSNHGTAVPLASINGATDVYAGIQSDEFIATEYANQSDPATFYSFTTETNTSYPDLSWINSIEVTIDHTKVSGDLDDYPLYVNLSLLGDEFWDNVKDGGGDIRVGSQSLKLELEALNVEVSDIIEITTDLSQQSYLMVAVLDTITLTEYVNPDKIHFAQLFFESLSISESVSVETIRFSPEMPRYRPRGKESRIRMNGRGEVNVRTQQGGRGTSVSRTGGHV